MECLLAVDKGCWLVLGSPAASEFRHFPRSDQCQRAVARILVCMQQMLFKSLKSFEGIAVLVSGSGRRIADVG